MPGQVASDNKVGPEPPVMTWGKALRVLSVTAVFDGLRLMFQWFWLFGPALAGTAAGFWLSQYVGDLAGGLVGAGVAAGTGFFLVAAYAGFGVVMAMIVGFLGWLTMGVLLLATNFRIFKTNATAGLWMLASLAIAETPFIGSIPSLTIATWRLYHTQIKKERAAHRVWQAARDRAEQGRQAAIGAYAAAQRQASAAATTGEEEIPQDAAVAT